MAGAACYAAADRIRTLRLIATTSSYVGHVRASGEIDACGTRTGSAEGVSRYPLDSYKQK